VAAFFHSIGDLTCADSLHLPGFLPNGLSPRRTPWLERRKDKPEYIVYLDRRGEMADLTEPGSTSIAQPTAQRGQSRLMHLIGIAAGIEVALYLGIGVGFGMTSQAAQRIVSIAGMVVYFVITIVAPYAGLLVWLVLYPFTETNLNIALGGRVPDLSPTRLMMGFLAITLMAQVAIRKRPLPRLSHLDFWGLLFVVGLGLSAATSAKPIAAIQVVLDSYLTPLVFYLLAKHLVTNRREIELLLSALLVIGGYTAFLAIHEQVTGVAWFLPADPGIPFYAGGLRVLRSLWGTNGVFGSIFALAIPIALYRMTESRSVPARAGYALLNVAFLLAMFLTYKRAAWIAMLISFAILFLFYPALRRVLTMMLIIAAVPVAMLWPRIATRSLIEDRIAFQADTLNGRTARWEVAVELWRQKPIFGVGFGNYSVLSGFVAIENQFLHILVSGGLVAFVPFAMFWLLMLRDAFRLYIRGPSRPGVFVDRRIMAVYLAVISTYLVMGLTAVQVTAISHMCYVLMGAVVGSQANAVRRRGLEARQALVTAAAPAPDGLAPLEQAQ
jgi:O-antigen ligase